MWEEWLARSESKQGGGSRALCPLPCRPYGSYFFVIRHSALSIITLGKSQVPVFPEAEFEQLARAAHRNQGHFLVRRKLFAESWLVSAAPHRTVGTAWSGHPAERSDRVAGEPNFQTSVSYWPGPGRWALELGSWVCAGVWVLGQVSLGEAFLEMSIVA